MASKVFILGVGRSGTTAVYNVLQQILSQHFNDDIDYAYEPFLWERNVFNKRITEITDEFSKVSSLSIDGIYNNKKLPLFVDEKHISDFVDNTFLRNLTRPVKDKNSLLVKFIRANGRFSLLRKISPDAKFIIILRNPLDVINSSINMFSLYGEDFYASDFGRLRKEVEEIWGDKIDHDLCLEVKECQYWYYMNRFMVQEYASNPENVLPIIYENYIKDREAELRKLCDFLGVAFKSSYVDQSARVVGLSHSRSNLTEYGYQGVLPYMGAYRRLVDKLGQEVDIEAILDKYRDRIFLKSRQLPFRGKTVLYLKNNIDRLCVKE